MHVKASGFAVFVLVHVLYMPLAVTVTPNPVKVSVSPPILAKHSLFHRPHETPKHKRIIKP